MMRKTDRKISRILDISPMPNHRMNSGMSPSGGIGRTISDGTRNNASISAIRPRNRPMAMPSVAPVKKAMPTRARLAPIWVQIPTPE